MVRFRLPSAASHMRTAVIGSGFGSSGRSPRTPDPRATRSALTSDGAARVAWRDLIFLVARARARGRLKKLSKPAGCATVEAASAKGLTTGGALTQLLEEWSQRVQFRAKAGPVTGFQLLHSAVVVAQSLPRPIGLGAGERGFGWRPRRGG